MEEIAAAAGVTKPLLYQHFSSKRALYLELIDDVTERLIAALAQAAVEARTPRERVEAGMRAYFGFVLDNRAAVRMLYNAPHDEELARGLRSLQSAITTFIAPLIDADIDDDHRRLAATAVVGLTEGVTRLWLEERAPSDLHGAELLAAQVAEIAWRGLRGVHRPE